MMDERVAALYAPGTRWLLKREHAVRVADGPPHRYESVQRWEPVETLVPCTIVAAATSSNFPKSPYWLVAIDAPEGGDGLAIPAYAFRAQLVPLAMPVGNITGGEGGEDPPF